MLGLDACSHQLDLSDYSFADEIQESPAPAEISLDQESPGLNLNDLKAPTLEVKQSSELSSNHLDSIYNSLEKFKDIGKFIGKFWLQHPREIFVVSTTAAGVAYTLGEVVTATVCKVVALGALITCWCQKDCDSAALLGRSAS